MAIAVTNALEGVEGIHGVVQCFSTEPGPHSAELLVKLLSRPPLRFRGLRRDLRVFLGRETLILPLQDGTEAEASIWYEIYNEESNWFDDSLRNFGFMPLETLLRVQELNVKEEIT